MQLVKCPFNHNSEDWVIFNLLKMLYAFIARHCINRGLFHFLAIASIIRRLIVMQNIQILTL